LQNLATFRRESIECKTHEPSSSRDQSVFLLTKDPGDRQPMHKVQQRFCSIANGDCLAVAIRLDHSHQQR
jgi:hypothetical protein